jgi:hypothetical protein
VPQFDVTALDGLDDAAAAIDATYGFVRDDGIRVVICRWRFGPNSTDSMTISCSHAAPRARRATCNERRVLPLPLSAPYQTLAPHPPFCYTSGMARIAIHDLPASKANPVAGEGQAFISRRRLIRIGCSGLLIGF